MSFRVLFPAVLMFGVLAAGFWLVSGTESRSRPAPAVNGPATRDASAFAVSRSVRSIASKRPATRSDTSHVPNKVIDRGGSFPAATYAADRKHDDDGAIARLAGASMPAPSLSFEGLTNFDNIAAYSAVILPPDMIGDVGPDHYVQAVNALVRIYDRSGNALTPPFMMSELFASLGTPCSTRNDGEPVVLYDPLADRWLLSQYCNNFPPFRQMIAISQTGDPTGQYFVYEFVMPGIKLNDVAKFGVWPDAYYMSTEEFTGADFSGTGMFAFDRDRMLAGDPAASYIYFSRPSLSADRLGNVLPSDLDGLRLPPAGAPNVFVGYSATEYGEAQDAIRLFDFHADFDEPSASTLTERPESPLPVAAFDPTSPAGRADITQPAPGEKLDANSDRLNYRAAYRQLADGESIVVNQTVRVSSDPYRAGVRVYELRRTGAGFSVREQSTIGDTASSRWIGRAAQDHQGNLAVGYDMVADDKQPALRYTGRLASEPAGTFRQEGTLIDGTGVQKAFGWRWGDYSSLTVDPTDDCTFWMTGQYYTLASQNFSDFTWLTRIGRFKFNECTAAGRSFITGNVTNADTGQPIAGVRMSAASYTRSTGADGGYGRLTVLPGSYTVTASAHGFRSQSFSVEAVDGQTATQNFALQPIPVFQNAGTAVSAENCGISGAPDPGEVVTVSITLQNNGARSAVDLTATLLAGNGVTSPGPAQHYGHMPVGGAGVTRPFSFTVEPDVTCGAVITLTLHLTDGTEDLGNITIDMQTGTPRIAFQQNFDRAQLPQLPPRWTRSAVNANGQPDYGRNWRISAKRSISSPKSAFSPDLNQVGVNEMISPVFAVTTPTARVTFQNWYELETTFLRNRLYDGSVLEVRIGSGEWQDIVAAGGAFESGGYDGIIDACCQNPLGGRAGWSGKSGVNQIPEFITTSVKLPPSAAGQFVQLRWRLGTDTGTFREGQYIDDLVITDGSVCGCSS